MNERELETLTAFYERMPAQRKREFWQLKGRYADKVSYLFRYGGVDRTEFAA